MAAPVHPIEIEQGSTFRMRFTFMENGKKKSLNNIRFVGVVKQSIYDEQGFPFRFERYDEFNVDVYLDADVSEQMDFKKGVYDIKMIQPDNMNTRLIQGPVVISLGATDATDYI